jgi:hypothetical protein
MGRHGRFTTVFVRSFMTNPHIRKGMKDIGRTENSKELIDSIPRRMERFHSAESSKMASRLGSTNAFNSDGKKLWAIDYTTNGHNPFANAPVEAFLYQFAFFVGKLKACMPIGVPTIW